MNFSDKIKFQREQNHLTQKEAADQISRWGLTPSGPLMPLGEAKHIFTHLEWQMTGWAACVDKSSGPFLFVCPDQLKEEFCLPSAFRAYTDQIFELAKEFENDNNSRLLPD